MKDILQTLLNLVCLSGVAFGRTTTQTTSHGQGNAGGGSSVPQQFQGRPASSKYLVRQRSTENVVARVVSSQCCNHSPLDVKLSADSG